MSAQIEKTMGINLSNVASATDVAWDRIADVFTSVRFIVQWSDIEAAPGVYTWTTLDAAIEAATSRGLQVLFVIGYGNVACGGATAGDAEQPNLSIEPPLTGTYWTYWENFVTTLIARYKYREVIWEVWNEPHSTTFWSTVDPSRYGSFAAKTVEVIKTEAPTAFVITGGGLPLYPHNSTPTLETTVNTQAWCEDFAEKFVAAGGAARADAVSIHPYRGVWPPEDCQWDLDVFRAIFQKPIVITEMGYSFGYKLREKNDGYPPAYADEYLNADDIARYYTRFMAWAAKNGVEMNYWFHYDDFYVSPWLNYVDFKAKRQTITSITSTTTTATATTAQKHGLANGDKVDIVGAYPAEYNVACATVTVTGDTTFTYPITSVSGVTATKVVPSAPMQFYTALSSTRDYIDLQSEYNFGLCEERDSTPAATGATAISGKRYVDDVEVTGGGAGYATPVITWAGLTNGTASEQAYAYATLTAGKVTGTVLKKLGDEEVPSPADILDDTSKAWDYPTATWDGDNEAGWKHTAYTAVSPFNLNAGELTCLNQTATVSHTAHGLVTGDMITVTGATQTEYNVVRALVTKVDANTFTYQFAGSATSPATTASNITITPNYTLTNPIVADGSSHYLVTCLIEDRTAGTVTVAFGGATAHTTISASATTDMTSSDTTSTLVVTPTNTFDGKIRISIKKIPSATSPGAGYVPQKLLKGTNEPYLSCATVTFSDPPTGEVDRAQAYAVCNSSGVITSLVVWNGGRNYQEAPTITISAPPVMPIAYPVLADGVLVGVDITDGGSYPDYITLGSDRYPILVGTPTTKLDNSSYTGQNTEVGTLYVAAKCTVGASNINVDSLSVQMCRDGVISNYTETVTAYIYTDSTGPSALVTNGTFSTKPLSDITNDKDDTALLEYTFYSTSATPAVLTASTAYWVVLKFSAVPTVGKVYLDTKASGTGTYATSMDGALWSLEDSKDCWVKLFDRNATVSVTENIGTSTGATKSLKRLQVYNCGTGFENPKVTQSVAAPTLTAVLVPVLRNGAVSDIRVDNPGGNYDVVPTLVIDAPTSGGTRATAVAKLASIPYEEAPKLAFYAAQKMRELLDGFTYVGDNSTNPNVHEYVFTDGTDDIAVVYAEKLIPATVTTWIDETGTVYTKPVYEGYGYVSAPTVTYPGQPTTLVGTAAVDSIQSYVDGTGYDYGIHITDRGAGYETAPTMVFSGGGSPTRVATGTTTVVNGRLAKARLSYPGNDNRGFTTAPVITLVGGGGHGAECECTLGAIGTITVDCAGVVYPAAPTAYLVGGFPTYTLPSTTTAVYKYDGSTINWKPGDTIDVTEDPYYVVY